MAFSEWCAANRITFDNESIVASLDQVAAYDGSLVVTDPAQPDHPIVFVSDYFQQITQYPKDEIVGKNCRFLQGPDTDPADVARIRSLIQSRSEGAVRLLNYTKSGQPFLNSFYIQPVQSSDGRMFFVGCQSNVSDSYPSEVQVPRGPKVPTNVIMVVNGMAIEPNGEAVPFRNEYIQGQVRLRVRTNPLDEAVAPFFDGFRRQFGLDIQFTVLKPAEGDFYVGGEVPGTMSLNLASKGMCSMLLKVIKMWDPLVHSSFGDEKHKERGHICFPFKNFAKYLIVTPPGEQPPPLGTTDPTPSPSPFLLPGYTYTLSFKSLCLSLSSWDIVNVPGLKSIGLRHFWGKFPLHVVAYTVPPGTKHHGADTKTTILDVEIIHSTLPRFPEAQALLR